MPVDHSKFKDIKQRNLRRQMLAEWYGEDYARTEVVAHGFLKATTLAEQLDVFTRKTFTAAVGNRISLESDWPKIAGAQLSALTRVGGFSDGVLQLEVRHAAFLRELDDTKDLLKNRVNQFLGQDACREIRFVAASGRWK